MTKSRTPLHLLAPLLFCWSEAAPAESDPPVTAEGVLAAYDARIHEAMGPLDGVRRCPRGHEGEDAIVVCGRNNESRMRLPLGSQPEEGARHRLIAGESPSGTDSVNVGRACCEHGGGINLIGLGGALARGLGNILHPD